ncbi:hypothetical protein MGG_16391 [Pyricularia oryzae 70-15]|uniref:Uncharacterized protein n=1 Tax=Pyricularia oryzae (strain 70-15 / ATCC MYA-4617 / FGSC 8958) TaxID=242507 RepID=G4MMA0_PYRO7|nr:uncharacterized protein MGG_16391 [Pyricularia oryzae 70-15]EHA57781.1 hypothetical protein MGG_16391 [Pyricularia oryzae 70-15]KAI7915471.1 hypothetical protein M0657_009054 [Pyricularia oryzae]
MKLVNMRGPCSPFATCQPRTGQAVDAHCSFEWVSCICPKKVSWGLAVWDSGKVGKKNPTDQRKWTPNFKGLWAYRTARAGGQTGVPSLADFDSIQGLQAPPSAGAAVGGLDV